MKFVAVFSVATIGFTSCVQRPEEEVKGCMDNTAVNYNAQATADAGGCVYIQEEQYSAFIKFSATWCHACGSYGAPAFVTVTENNPGQILAFAVQNGDDFVSANPAMGPIYSAYDTKFSISAMPSFAVNDNFLGNPVSGAQSAINTKNATDPVAGIGIHYTIGAGANAGKLNINTYMKFFQPASGEYYVAVYLLHKEIVKTQNNGGTYEDDFVHHHVLCATVTPLWGEVFSTGNVTAGRVFNKGYVFPYNVPELDINKMDVVGVIYKKVGTNYELVNVTPNV